MPEYEFKVKIDARDINEAKEILQAMFDLMKATRHELSTKDFVEMAKKVKEKPSLILSAKLFI